MDKPAKLNVDMCRFAWGPHPHQQLQRHPRPQNEPQLLPKRNRMVRDKKNFLYRFISSSVHPTELLRCTSLSYAAPYWAELHPMLYWATLLPTELSCTLCCTELRCTRRNKRLIESNAKCRYLKNLSTKGLSGRFLSVCEPPPPSVKTTSCFGVFIVN